VRGAFPLGIKSKRVAPVAGGNKQVRQKLKSTFMSRPGYKEQGISAGALIADASTLPGVEIA